MLRCLYAQKNLIASIGPSDLAGLDALVTLDLSHNNLKTLENFAETVPNLKTLILTRNRLSAPEDIAELARLEQLAHCDVAHNELEYDEGDDGERLLRALAAGPAIATLNLSGNPFMAKAKHVRKRLICLMPKLQCVVGPRATARPRARPRFGGM